MARATSSPLSLTATHCNTLQHTATHCNTLQQAYHKGAEWLGRQAALSLDRLADKILPLIKTLHRHGTRGGGGGGEGHGEGRKIELSGFGREGNVAVEEAIMVVPAALGVCRRRVRALLEVCVCFTALCVTRCIF